MCVPLVDDAQECQHDCSLQMPLAMELSEVNMKAMVNSDKSILAGWYVPLPGN